MSLFRSRACVLAVIATLVAFVLPVLGLGCGPGPIEVDKAAEYTPESIAQELAFRYRALNPEAKKSTRKIRPKSKSDKSVADLERDERAEKKNKNTEATKKRTGPPTIDDVMEDLDTKLNKIKGTSRSESCQKVIETISKDSSLTESDRQNLTEKLRELAGGS